MRSVARRSQELILRLQMGQTPLGQSHLLHRMTLSHGMTGFQMESVKRATEVTSKRALGANPWTP